MSDSSSSVTVSIKLLIDTEAKRVLFAEAGKDFVDFLFHMLSLPVSKLISLVGKKEMVGSLSNLYDSIENLNESYIDPNQTRDALLKHVSSVATGFCVPLLAIKPPVATTPAKITKKFYRCNCGHGQNHYYDCSSCGSEYCKGANGFRHVADDARAVCPTCAKQMNKLVEYVEYETGAAADDRQAELSSITESGFVKEVVTYMVMDDLAVKPMSTISSMTLLDELGVKDVFALQEKVVSLGMTEAVKLLKASLESKNVLTCVFLEADKY